MHFPVGSRVERTPWLSLWIVALISLVLQLWLCQFFSFGETVPLSLDINPSNLWKQGYHFPPTGTFQVLNWLGQAYLPPPLNPFTLAVAQMSTWWLFTAYVPLIATGALLAMAAFLRELELPRPAALFGAVVYAWQGDLLPFVYPGHYGYMTTWMFFALAAWGALRAQRLGHWAYPVVSGASCGLMIGLQADRGAIASLLIGALYLAPLMQAPATGHPRGYLIMARQLPLCVAVAALIAVAPLLALFQSNVVGAKMGGQDDREQTYKLVTQYSLAPAETLTYLAPGFFGWHVNSLGGPYWGWIGEWPDWPKNHQGTRNLNLAISTTGTIASVLALLGAIVLLPGALLGAAPVSSRQRFYGCMLLILGGFTLVLSWGWHTAFYRPLFDLPLMDKWRNPLKWLEMTNFALPVLAAIGAQHLLAALESDSPEAQTIRRRTGAFLWTLTGLIGVALILTYPLALPMAVRLQSEGFAPEAVTIMMSTMHTSLMWALVLMVLLLFLLRALAQPERLREWKLENPWLNVLWQQAFKAESISSTLGLGLAALAVVQLAWVATHFLVATPLVILTASNPLIDALKSEGNQVRSTVSAEDPMLNVLLQNQFAAAGLSCLDISAASRIPDDLTTFFNTLQNDRPRLWLLAGVKNVVVPEAYLDQMKQNPGISADIANASGYTLQPTPSPDVPSHAVVALKNYFGKATLVPAAEPFTSDEVLLKRLADPAWNPRASLLLMASEDTTPAAPSGPVSAQDDVFVQTYTPTDIRVSVRSASGGYLLVNDQYDPDWSVQVDGKDARLLRADYILRAVAVPPGDSTVTMRYAARYHIGGIVRQLTGLNLPGLAISAEAANDFSDAAMLLAWIVAAMALWRARMRSAPQTVLAGTRS